LHKLKRQKQLHTNNLLLHGDNYEGLLYLIEQKNLAGKISLIYIDPPYGTKQEFTLSTDRISTMSRTKKGRLAYSDTLTGDEYLEFLRGRLALLHDMLAEDGSFYLHIDNKMAHYVKVLTDSIFGQKNFINHITRIKCNPKNFSRKGYGNITDTILFYSKSKKNIWNNPRQEFHNGKDTARFKQQDSSGRAYTTTPLHAPGETTKGNTGKQWRGMFPPPGRHWRYDPKVLDELDKQGIIEWSRTGNPRKKSYADDVKNAGLKMQDIWTFKDPQNPKYPTEKNLEMLEMIVGASSNEGDIVLDAFCGSGSTLQAANSLNRKWIGIDSSDEAIAICRKRLENFSLIKV
jgi:adenine-specific DNA-methyltransferase